MNPAILPFCSPKVHVDNGDVEMVNIPVMMIDSTKGTTTYKTNINVKTFLGGGLVRGDRFGIVGGDVESDSVLLGEISFVTPFIRGVSLLVQMFNQTGKWNHASKHKNVIMEKMR